MRLSSFYTYKEERTLEICDDPQNEVILLVGGYRLYMLPSLLHRCTL